METTDRFETLGTDDAIAVDPESAPADERPRPYYTIHEDAEGDLVATVFLRKSYPIVGRNGRTGTIREITMREPVQGTIAEIVDRCYDRKGTMGLRMISALSHVPIATLSKLKARDAAACGEAMAKLGFDLKDLGEDTSGERFDPEA